MINQKGGIERQIYPPAIPYLLDLLHEREDRYLRTSTSETLPWYLRCGKRTSLFEIDGSW